MSEILPYKGIFPKIHPSVYIAPGTVIIGDVEIGENSSVWPNCVIRGDVAPIRIGCNSNVQDGSVIHVSRNGGEAIIGDHVTVGHMVLLHACKISNKAFVGMGSVIMDGVVLESASYVAAGSLVTSNKILRAHELWAGHPAKFMRLLTPSEVYEINASAERYVQLAQEYTSRT
jgi:carbonic anhydrase/acetyltransferase-like protein (isoleucine patch superfamily)